MIKIYGMKTCPDCMAVDKQAEGNNRYEVIDIGDHVKYFAEAREKGYIGIPCFVLEDGTVTLDPEKAGLGSEQHEAPSCRLDGSGC